jgi:hypothetical protein
MVYLTNIPGNSHSREVWETLIVVLKVGRMLKSPGEALGLY